ncbi:MAG: 3-hydroxyacyl-CoA dehydrogenase [Marine Group III euryarchaeote CG-Epi4]|uniref:3-hydroxyacyl-CoA dehydrogenase n=1 Tax=Marine Group III euryarchaeote CG-Epi4 TaxID=1888998 RepID=A0A1J5TGR6_9ARCH|nr:MAG: 3-hydroxyacyl-CoA dehydrogenase [Marine Group III euryarchaeote CG-Epi4]
MEIKKVAVIGAGLMGSGIAAQVANAGFPVTLLDIVPDGAINRNVIAESAVSKMLKPVKLGSPTPLMHRSNAKLITTGNIEDNLDFIKDADLIIEVVLERLDVKHDVFRKIDKFRKKGSIITSNTSTIPREQLLEGMAESFAKDFMITHFFNPPRYLRLLEIVSGNEVSQEKIQIVSDFCDITLGKEVVVCNDTPGFIGNRIGTYWTLVGMVEAVKSGLTVEEADAVMSRPIGAPKTGLFGLADVVGIDLIPHVTSSMISNLPKTDPYCIAYSEQEKLGISQLFSDMVDSGYTGRKGKGGFYRLNLSSGSKVKESRDLKTGNYSRSIKPKNLRSVKAAKKGLRTLVEYDDKGGKFAWQVLSKTLSYAASLVPEITQNVVNVDIAMKNGFLWKKGPFEMLDALGPSWFVNKLKSEGLDVPKILESVGDGYFYSENENNLNYFTIGGKYEKVPKPEGYLSVSDISRGKTAIFRNPSIKLWDMGDEILLAEFVSKMNSIDPLIMEGLSEAASLCESGKFKGLVIGNDGTNFSAGANLGLASFICNVGAWGEVDKFVEGGQLTFMSLKHGSFPVVGASSGLALGGGCEVLLACDRIQAHSETYIGLVEVGVGVVPAWGGCKEMIRRWNADSKSPKGPMGSIVKIFENLGTAKVASSAQEARDMKFLLEGDDITMNRSRVLYDAKQTCLRLADGYVPPEINEYQLPGLSGKAALDLAVSDLVKSGHATPHDVVVTDKLAYILTGGDTDFLDKVSEDKLLEMERESFVDLVKTEATLDRFEHMLTKGKPLRN